ncbi:MAG: diguanylate cyclase domain-containing protein [bacterium]
MDGINGFQIGAIVSTLGGGVGFFTIFLYLFIKERESYLKYWAISWGLTVISLLIFVVNINQMLFILMILYELCIVISGYALQKGTSLYLDPHKKKQWLIIFLSIVILLIVYKALSGNIFMLLWLSPAYMSFSYIISGILLSFKSNHFFPRTIGVISLLFGLFTSPSSYLYQYSWLVNYITPIIGSLGSIFGLGLIGLHYKKMHDKLEKIKQQYQDVVETQQELVCRYKPDTTLTFINNTYCQVLNRSRNILIGTKFLHFIPVEEYNSILKMISNLEPQNPTIKYEHPLKLPDDSIIFIENNIHGFFDQNGRLNEIQSVGRDITKRKEKEAIITKLSFHDQLTDLYNRRYFENKITNLNKSSIIPITIIIADLDGLKYINDNYGHQMGDKFIIKAGNILKSCIRQDDTIARIGGDEFSIILTGVDSSIARRVCNDINTKLEAFNKQSELPEPIQISLGHATKFEKNENLQNVFKEADLNMYKNKGLRRKD